jgi:hypothetical protein
MSDNKSSLLASLTGESVDADQDLFGEIPSDNAEDLFGNISLDDPLQQQDTAPVAVAAAAPPVVVAAAPPPQIRIVPPDHPSLLASSGLLGNKDPRSDGLFDAIDEEQERLDQEERRRALQQERMDQERARLEQARAAEEARLAQQMQAQQQQMPPQQQQQQQQQHVPIQGFYRNHNIPPAAPPPMAASYNGNLQYSTVGGPVQTHVIRRPTTTAGMHNVGNANIRPPSVRPISAPSSAESPYVKIIVTEPMLVASGGLFLNSPYWSYQVETTLKERGSWLVRRRFKHVVALEQRLREECPGSILPPR